MFENGEHGVKVNWSEARKYYKQASIQGKIYPFLCLFSLRKAMKMLLSGLG